MSLAIDSLVTDLMFQSGDALDPEVLVEVLGGQEELAKKQVLDPDMQDPRFEMELSPSMPFRRRDERRLMLIDDSVAPMRPDPQATSVISVDLREARGELIKVCAAVPVRVGRLFALGSWGDAVWVVRSFRDLRGLCLISWALDPAMDIDGRRRATPLGQSEFEEKLMAYDKRLDELDDDQIRDSLGDASIEEREDGLIIIDMLEEDGTWDQKNSLKREMAVASIDRFSHFPGAKHTSNASSDGQPAAEATPTASTPAAPSQDEVKEPAPSQDDAVDTVPLQTKRLGESILLVFPLERFDLEVASKLGKEDWDSILAPVDNIDGATKDVLYRDGADFVAPIEFFSEVFLQGKPLSKPQFEEGATTHKGVYSGVKTMEVQLPRFGPVMLFARPDGSRFVSSNLQAAEAVLGMLG
ncbi:MAG: hypothetical protein GY811_10455 [Myxococcales bacterium]|nr:hypothetical protein [Myxococcales bacterium]